MYFNYFDFEKKKKIIVIACKRIIPREVNLTLLSYL